jgi:ligand-binding sensor domain-containing protein
MDFRSLLIITLLPFASFYSLYSQNPEWIPYTTGNYVSALVLDKNYIWAGTSVGLLKIDKKTHEIIQYDHTNSGIPNDNVYALAIDAAGNKWLGTSEGMAMFDGTNWTVYDSSNSTLSQTAIYAIIIDSTGAKWIGSNKGGLTKYDGVHWTTYTSSNSGLPNNIVLCLTIDRSGIMWIGTQDGLATYDGTNWTAYPRLSRDGETSLLVGDSTIIWIGTGGGGLVKYDGISWTTYTITNSGTSIDHVKALASDPLGNIWIGTWGNGLVKFDGIHWTVFSTKNSGLPNNYIDALTVDSSGGIFIGTYGGGLILFKQETVVCVQEGTINSQLSDEFYLSQNYPNPFNPVTNFSFHLPKESLFTLKVFDLIGREVKTIASGVLPPGDYTRTWNAEGLPSGIYFYRFQTTAFTVVKNLILVK